MALVAIPTEENSYKQSYWFNRNVDADGTVTDNSGTASRDVTVTTVTYRGDRSSVLSAISQAQAYGRATAVRKIDGPWYEGTATIVTYGAWTIVMDSQQQQSS